MDDVVAVQRHHAQGQLRQRGAEPRQVEPAAGSDVAEEVGPLEQVHREEPLPAVGLERVQADQVRVAEVGRRAELALEAVEPGAVDLRQELQGHAVAAGDVHGLEDDPHSAPPQLADEPVVAEPLRGRRRDRPGGSSPRPESEPAVLDVDSRNTCRTAVANFGNRSM